MKKILTILAILMVAVVGRTYADDEVVWTEVYTAEQFYSVIKNNHSANVKLGADIDLSDHDASDDCIFNFGFSGKIDGGYTDSNGNELNHKLMNSKNDLLFNYLENAAISNLTISNCSFDGWDTHSGWFGTEAKYSTFTDIEILNCSGNGDNTLFDNDCMGGLLGSAKHCTFTRVYSINSSIETDGERAGLIVGKDEYSTFTECITGPTSSIWVDGNANNAYCGGICGDCTGSSLTDCTNMALVCSKDDRTGGVIGFGSETTLTNCTNVGIVCNASKSAYKTIKSNLTAQISAIVMASAAGVGIATVATMYTTAILGTFNIIHLAYDSVFAANVLMLTAGKEATLAQLVGKFARHGKQFVLGGKHLVSVGLVKVSFVVVAVTATVLASYGFYYDLYRADEIGGIAGKLDNGSVADRCMNLGSVDCADVECGGIVGYLDGSTVRNCLNRGLVKGENRTGGIAGYCNNNSKLEYNVNLAGFNALGGDGGYIYDEGNHGDLTAKCNYYVYGSTKDNGNGCIGETPQNFATGSVALALNNAAGDTIWHQNLGNSMYPVPVATVPVVTALTDKPATAEKVSSPGDFIIVVSNPYAVVSLEADLDMSGAQCIDLSTEETPFRGKIYGNGHKISNFSFEVPLCTDDNSTSNVAIFSFAEGAEFHNLTIENFHYTQKGMPTFNYNKKPQNVEALLVANSTGCTYDSIAIKNSSIKKNDNVRKVGGMVSLSNNDTFTNCSVDGNCLFQAQTGSTMDDALLGGIAAVAKGSKFSYCYSGASLWSDDNRVGGIVGELEDGSIDHCFNSGTVNSHERVGGIVGFAKNTSVTYCSNTGVLADGKDTRQDWRGGIIGRLEGSSAYKAYNLNFGSLNYMASKCEAIGKLDDNAVDGGNNYYYCQYNGDHKDNESSFTEENSIYRYEKMLSGEFACNAVDANGNAWVYQDIDNNTFSTHLPTPIPAAGKVYSNILCDGTQSYSNKYNSTGAHTGVADQFGYCTTCGMQIGAANEEVHIKDSLELIQFAYNVNRGADFSSSTVYLDNDINLAYCDFPMIGNTTNPFKGTFDGQGHRILNMTLDFAKGCVGFFGCAAGDNTIIKNIIIDSSCSVTSNGDNYGIAGLIGGVQSTSGSECNITIENCGNEASVSGYGNVAGLLGGVFINDATVVNINNCYNTGAISGSSKTGSGSIVGYARKHTSIRNTYNSGTVGGTTDWLTFAFTGADDFDGTIENCFTTVSGDKTPNVAKTSADRVTSGELCSMLNKTAIVFSQDLADTVITYPVPGTEGLVGTTILHISTAEELVAFAASVNNGNSYYGSIVDLDNDIDLSGVTFTAIGNEDHYFMGTFNGQGHRIKNMIIESNTGYQGLFSIVSGSDCVVKNTIIDSSCSVTSKSGKGVAGLIGCVSSTSGSVCNLTIENCGNEANVSGYENVAGLLGGVYNNDATIVNISNCYNTGAIGGNTYSACGSIVGWTRKHTSIYNTYNCGTVGGTNDWLSFACTMADDFDGTIENCYTTVSGDKTPNVKKMAAYTVASGDLCNRLNDYYSQESGTAILLQTDAALRTTATTATSETYAFSQTSGVAYPIPGAEGLTGDPEDYWIEVSTAEEFKSAADMTTVNSGSPVRIRLTADIDLSSLSAISSGDEKGYLFTTNYNGVIDGNGYALKNCTHCLFYRTSRATIKNITLDGFKVTAQPSLIARTSGSSEFDSITVKNSSLTHSSDDMNNFGMIVGYSNSDNISYCSVESGCTVTANRRQTGGLVGEMFGGSISYCHNGATVTGDADYIGGIVALSGESGTGSGARIAYCLNTGTINGDDECGGIVGQYYDGRITNCVNTGTIGSKDGDNHSNVGGIIGKLCSAECDTCINFGSVAKAKSSTAQYAIYGGSDGTITATGNDYYCNVKGSHVESGIIYADLLTGKYAYTKGWLYQDIDNGTYTVTSYPVPLLEAGTVYSNILCDGTQTYSNIYQGTADHESQLDDDDVCTLCGMITKHITDAAGLESLSTAVNNANDKKFYNVYLDNDIALTQIVDATLGATHTPIGSETSPFKGRFDGQGHCISDMRLTCESNNVGLFGVVSGPNTLIKNVVIGNGCTISSLASDDNTKTYGIAGIAGSVTSTSAIPCNVTIENCGNEAYITQGDYNVAGILGRVMDNNSTITINNCYNTSAISGNYSPSTICGYAGNNYTFTNCYNGDYNDYPLYQTGSSISAASSAMNCYTVNSSEEENVTLPAGVTRIDAYQLRLGNLCQLLNANCAENTVWSAWTQEISQQDVAKNAHPTFGTEGLHYVRTMANQWGTICLPFAVENGDGYDFYELSDVTDDALTLKKVEGTLAAGTPAIVRRSSSATGIDVAAIGDTFADTPVLGSSANGLTITGAFSSTADDLFNPYIHAFESTDITSHDGYIIANNAFWNIQTVKGENKVYCSPFRAYLAGTASSAKLTIGGFDDDIPTAVEAINAITTGTAEYYDINGRKLSDLQQGVNIMKFKNGTTKKVIIK